MLQVWFHLGTPQTLSSPGRWSLVQTQSSTMAPMPTVTGIYILVVRASSYNEVRSVFLDTFCRDSSFLMTTWCVLPLISPSQERKEYLHIWISLFVSLPKDILIYHFVMIRMYVSCIFPTKILLGFGCMFFRNSTRSGFPWERGQRSRFTNPGSPMMMGILPESQGTWRLWS